jgi:hypothetical protein
VTYCSHAFVVVDEQSGADATPHDETLVGSMNE